MVTGNDPIVREGRLDLLRNTRPKTKKTIKSVNKDNRITRTAPLKRSNHSPPTITPPEYKIDMTILARIVRVREPCERSKIARHVEPRDLRAEVQHLEIRECRVIDGESLHEGAVDGDGRHGPCYGQVGSGVDFICSVRGGAVSINTMKSMSSMCMKSEGEGVRAGCLPVEVPSDQHRLILRRLETRAPEYQRRAEDSLIVRLVVQVGVQVGEFFARRFHS